MSVGIYVQNFDQIQPWGASHFVTFSFQRNLLASNPKRTVTSRSMSWERKMQGYIDNLQSLNDTVQGSKEWLEARRCRLTASNFRAIAKMCAAISPKNTIKSFFYNPLKGNVATAYGQEQERPTEAEFVDGFVSRGACEISVAHTGLGGVERERALVASPDGIVCCHPGSSDYPIVEYKTAKMLVDQQITVDDTIGGIKDFPVTFGKDRRSYELKRSHNFFYQVQWVMAATGISHAAFVIRGAKKSMAVAWVQFDEDFFHQCVVKLRRFYYEAVLPELVHPLMNVSGPRPYFVEWKYDDIH